MIGRENGVFVKKENVIVETKKKRVQREVRGRAKENWQRGQ